MRTWMKLAIVVAVLGAAGTTFAVAAGAHGERRLRFMKHMIDARVEDALEDLNATPAQKQAIDAAKDDIVAKLGAHLDAQHGKHAELVAALTADKLDEATVLKFVDRRTDEAKVLAKEVAPDVVTIHDTLTADQRKKLAERFQHEGGHWGGGF